MNRTQHLQWCKNRALAYLREGQCYAALASFLSDMNKHTETADHIGLQMPAGMEGMNAARRNDAEGLEKWITGFN